MQTQVTHFDVEAIDGDGQSTQRSEVPEVHPKHGLGVAGDRNRPTLGVAILLVGVISSLCAIIGLPCSWSRI